MIKTYSSSEDQQPIPVKPLHEHYLSSRLISKSSEEGSITHLVGVEAVLELDKVVYAICISLLNYPDMMEGSMIDSSLGMHRNINQEVQVDYSAAKLKVTQPASERSVVVFLHFHEIVGAGGGRVVGGFGGGGGRVVGEGGGGGRRVVGGGGGGGGRVVGGGGGWGAVRWLKGEDGVPACLG
ncbi:unnamed protein product [Strongylus vulgaris]|uniref:Uncharacterized protein n=1 Tax=Strongylus vulgaris TaxID=40348 RepID=A0A3P7JQ00_STRVU|nr:unnamed protein product [Strongylus vulgaris]